MSKFAEVGDRGVTAPPLGRRWEISGDDVLVAEEMFAGFTLDRIDVGGVVLRVRYGGAGPPVLLLHGQPTWSYLYRTVVRELVARGLAPSATRGWFRVKLVIATA